MSDIPTTHTLPEDALRMMRTAFRMDPRSARCLEDAEAAITRLREHAAGLALERDGFQEECKRLRADLAAAQAREQRMREALERIEQWGRAYPLSVFPEPDFDKARKALEAAGLTLDAVSASNMRHVVEGVSEIARAALGEPQ